MPAKRPAPRLALVNEQHMTEAQRALLASLRAGPRGASITPRGPFAVWMHAPELGELAVSRRGTSTVFDLGEWRSSVASRKNDDGTISFMTIDPGVAGFEFVESKRNDKRALIVREGQHEYIFMEAP